MPVLTHNTTTYDTDRDKADALNSFFNSCFNSIVTPLQETPGDATMPNDISDLLCTEEEVAGFSDHSTPLRLMAIMVYLLVCSSQLPLPLLPQ